MAVTVREVLWKLGGLLDMDKEQALMFFRKFMNVPPGMLMWQDQDHLSSLCVSPHVAFATAVLAGEGVDQTAYVQGHTMTWDENTTEGQPGAFKTLIQSMKETGWDGFPIRIAIDGAGHLVITDGLHRSAAALGVGLATIPCEVVYRDVKWLALKQVVLALGDGEPKLYQPLPHPDFEDWPVWRHDTEVRAGVILQYLRRIHGQGKVLRGIDLGCNTGTLTCRIARGTEDLSVQMTGLDVELRAVQVANWQAGWMAADAYFRTSIEVPDLDDPCWDDGLDFVVCLSLLNHYQCDPDRQRVGFELFDVCLQAPLVFLDAPAPGDPVGGDSKFTDPAEVFKWCAQADPAGHGEIVGIMSNAHSDGLQRPLLAWHRG